MRFDRAARIRRVQARMRFAATFGWALAMPGCGGDDTSSNDETEPTTDDGGPSSSSGNGADAATDATSASSDADATADDSTGPDPSESGDTPSSVLVTIDDSTDPPRLWFVDPSTGQGTVRCDLAPGNGYNAVAIDADGQLVVHNALKQRIERIDPCNCGFVVVGLTGAGAGLELEFDAAGELKAIDPALSAFLTVDASTGLATVVGPVEDTFGDASLVRGPTDDALWIVDGTANRLLGIDRITGQVGSTVPLDTDVGPLGIARSPDGDVLYLCSGDTLHQLDETSGALTAVGAIGLPTACDNLGAPPPLACD